MEEAAELGNYLPLSFKTRSEQAYIAFLACHIADRPEIVSIRTLHEVLKSVYGRDDEHGVQ